MKNFINNKTLMSFILICSVFVGIKSKAITPYESYKSRFSSMKILPFDGSEELISEIKTKEYLVQEWHINTISSGDILFSIRRPLLQDKPLPIIALFSGFQTGKKALELIKDQSSSIIVSYEYPAAINKEDLSFDLEKLRVSSLQIAQLVAWLSEKKWVDSDKINLVAVSFGGAFVPLANQILIENNLIPASITLAYTGVDLSKVIANYFSQFIGSNEVNILETLASMYLWDIEPFYYLPQFRSDTLIVLAKDEKVFLETSIDLMIKTIPTEKTIIELPGPHIQPDRQDLIDKLIKSINDWLSSRGHI